MSSVLASIIEVQALSLTLCMLCHHMLENNDAATKLSRRRAPSAASPLRRLSVLLCRARASMAADAEKLSATSPAPFSNYSR